MNPICPYCNKESVKTDGNVIYPHRPDLASKIFYLCEPCDAYVGCHPKTDKPLGRLANAELRKYKSNAHRCFDPIWKEGKMTRGEAYEWLSLKLGIMKVDCHIGMFDVEMCKKVCAITLSYRGIERKTNEKISKN